MLLFRWLLRRPWQLGYVYVGSYTHWQVMWSSRKPCGWFLNSPEVRPGRWGFYVLAFEFGSRNPGDWIGVRLHRWGLFHA